MTSKAKKFFRNQAVIRRAVISSIGNKGGVIHGRRAVNAQLPRFLEVPTKDYDVFVKSPKKRALALEKKLDKIFRGDFFKVKKGKSKTVNVHKVKDNITNETIVDFSRPIRKVETKVINFLKFASLKDQKEQALRNLKDPRATFRRDKDRDVLARIRILEGIRRRKI